MAVLVSHETDGLDNVVSLYDLETGSLVRSYKIGKQEPPIGRFAAISNEHFIGAQRGKPVCCLWQIGGHDTPLFRFPVGGTVNALVVSRCTRYICVAMHSRVLVYEAASGNLRGVIAGTHFLAVSSLRFSESGRFLATAADDGLACVWHFAESIQNESTETSVDEHGVQSEQSRALRERIEAHALPVRDCAFTQDERCLVTASADQTVRVHDLQSEVSRTRTVCELDSAATTLCIAPLLNDTVFCGTQSGCIFEAHLQDASASGRVFKGHSKGVTAVWCAALRLNDSSLVRLVSSSLDGDVRVWDVASALTVSRIAVHNAVLDVTVFRSVPHAAVSRLALGEAAKQSAAQSRSVVHRFNKLPTDSDDVVVRLTGRPESGSFFDLDQAGTDGNTNDAEADLKAERDQLWAANKRLCLRLLNKALNGS